MRNLRQFARAFDRFEAQVQGQFARLRTDLVALIEAESKPKRTPAPKRRERWTGPVDDAERTKRQSTWSARYILALELGLDPSATFFCAAHRLGHPSVMSRWTTGGARSIRPGSALDKRLWRAVREDAAKLESLRPSAMAWRTLPIRRRESRVTMSACPMITALSRSNRKSRFVSPNSARRPTSFVRSMPIGLRNSRSAKLANSYRER
jgi:hypothetical protein